MNSDQCFLTWNEFEEYSRAHCLDFWREGIMLVMLSVTVNLNNGQ